MVTRAEVRDKLRSAMELLESARRMIADDTRGIFTIEDAHYVAKAQYRAGKAYEKLDVVSRKRR